MTVVGILARETRPIQIPSYAPACRNYICAQPERWDSEMVALMNESDGPRPAEGPEIHTNSLSKGP
jgi:hypothetical protein